MIRPGGFDTIFKSLFRHAPFQVSTKKFIRLWAKVSPGKSAFIGILRLTERICIFKTFPLKWTLSSGVLALLCGRSRRLVECKSKSALPKRLLNRKKEDEVLFNWRRLLSFLWPEKWILAAAIVVRRCYNKSLWNLIVLSESVDVWPGRCS